MFNIVANIYILCMFIIAILNIGLALECRKRAVGNDRLTAAPIAGAAAVGLSYLFSIILPGYFAASVFSSLYFLSVDFMVLTLLHYSDAVTGSHLKIIRPFYPILQLWFLVEVVAFAINPFKDFVISYVDKGGNIARYHYVMHLPYYLHLSYTYLMIIVVLFLLIGHMIGIPREYHNPFRLIAYGIIGIILINAVFLFISASSNLDFSIVAYGIVTGLMYWNIVDKKNQAMLDQFKSMVFEKVDQGIVFFDYKNTQMLHNDRAVRLLPGSVLKQEMPISEFTQRCGIIINQEKAENGFTQQIYLKKEEVSERYPLRTDYSVLKNKKGKHLGTLFVFTDVTLETDLQTGFHQWESFKRYAKENEEFVDFQVTTAVCDINGLGIINTTFGKQKGDETIARLADAMRRCFPKESSYFVRGHDAALIVLVYESTTEYVKNHLDAMIDSLDFSVQYAVAQSGHKESNIMDAINEAFHALKVKKLLDRESTHSTILNTLMKAQQQNDVDTEAHVRRTQKLGAELGKRLGLSDAEQTDLALLCIMHDIGKIGIPLEVLNKPGRLNDREWNVLKSHVEKGYQIAMSSGDYASIAPMIRHHHERWDGKGYPDGLSQESIPLLSRIIAVVDSYDAMVNDRIYRKALSKEEALSELAKCSGKQFSPHITAEFIRMIKEMPEYEEKVPEEPDTAAVPEQIQSWSEDEISEDQAVVGTNVHEVFYCRYILNEKQQIVETDEYFEKMTGYIPEEVIAQGKSQINLIPEEDRMDYLFKLSANLASHHMAYFEHRLLCADGHIKYVMCYGREYFDSVSKNNYAEVIICDSAKTYATTLLMQKEKQKAEVQLRSWEQTFRKDSLTGLLNHSAFETDVELQILENDSIIVMLMMDLDYFKNYNDTYGHHAGDELLVLFGQILQSALRDQDLSCRMGGDEFSATLRFRKESTDEIIRARVMQIFNKLTMTLATQQGKCSVSMGAVISGKEKSFNELYESADKALYSSKKNGRGKLLFYGDEENLTEAAASESYGQRSYR